MFVFLDKLFFFYGISKYGIIVYVMISYIQGNKKHIKLNNIINWKFKNHISQQGRKWYLQANLHKENIISLFLISGKR